jgi:aminopeptidase YwaD
MKTRHLQIQTLVCISIVFSASIFTVGAAASITKQTNTAKEQYYLAASQESSDILQMIQQVNASQLRSYIQHISQFGPHPTGSTACIALATYLYDTLGSFGLPVQYDPWFYKLRTGKNIEATLQGTSNPNGIVIISAHYDSVKVSPGADDDGSGVAAVLAVADILSKNHFNSTIRFVLFSGEEQGLLGSHEYAQDAYQNHENIIADLNLDGVGYAATTEDGSLIKHHTNNQSAWMVDISQAIATTYWDEIQLNVLRLPPVSFSDHASFVTYHYDASYLLEYTLNPYYHTSNDTLDHMNITYLTKVCKLAVGTLATIAQLYPLLADSDLTISLRGSIISYPTQFSVRVENNKAMLDSANVTITIMIRNLRTGQLVNILNDPYNRTCNWTFTEEITDFWDFHTQGKQYQNQIISLDVIVKGIKDDLTVYTTQHTVGVLLHHSFYLIPTR